MDNVLMGNQSRILWIVYLVVTDLEVARNRLLERGVEVPKIRHKTPIGAWNGGFASGLDHGARTLCQLRELLRSGWQQLGATGAGLSERMTEAC